MSSCDNEIKIVCNGTIPLGASPDEGAMSSDVSTSVIHDCPIDVIGDWRLSAFARVSTRKATGRKEINFYIDKLMYMTLYWPTDFKYRRSHLKVTTESMYKEHSVLSIF